MSGDIKTNNNPNNCGKCGKAVYMAEKLVAIGKVKLKLI